MVTGGAQPIIVVGLWVEDEPMRQLIKDCGMHTFKIACKCKGNTSRDPLLSSLCRHKAVSSVCRPQTWQEQHPEAQTGHPAHHAHE